MWSKSWKYKEGIVIGGGLFVTGLLLQTTVGEINWNVLAYPVNVMVLAALTAVLIGMHRLRKKVYLFSWMSHYTAAVSSLFWAAGFTVAMGLIRQVPAAGPVSGIPVFSRMLSAWPFVLIYFWLTAVLGMTVLRAGFPVSRRKIPFLLNHAGLFIVLIAATLGSADRKRMKMTVPSGRAEWRAADERGNVYELPFTVELQEFTVDEYPPKLMLIDNRTGKVLPQGNPVHLLLEDNIRSGDLQDWRIDVLQSLPQAALFTAKDTVSFLPFGSAGAAYAVYLEAVNALNGEKARGWVSCGSFMFPGKALRLDSLTSLVMPRREPQRFASRVKVYARTGKITEGTVEVNRPLAAEGWKIYQSGYDQSKGRWSDISIFELVRDPWLPAVYAGILMMGAGAVLLFAGRRKQNKEEEV